MEFGKRVTVVDYDLTSGSDNDDRDDDQSYIYCSIARPLSPGNRLRHDGDAQQRSDSDDCPPEIKRARTEDDSSHSSTQSSESSCESASSCSDQEESDHSEPMPAAPPPVAISIPSDHDEQEDDGDEEEPEQPLVAPFLSREELTRCVLQISHQTWKDS